MTHRALSIVTAALMALVSTAARAQPGETRSAADFTTFYPVATSVAEAPPPVTDLLKVCEQRSDSFYLSLWALQGGPVRIAVFTERPVEDLSKVVSLRVLFTMPGQGSQGLPRPTARPAPGASLDWAYTFDRNGDGKVDYLAYLVGAHAVEADDFPTDYPKGGQPLKFKDYELFLKSARLVFSHRADENFDGTVDAVVEPLIDPDRPMWLYANGVLRSSHFDGVVDDEWAFRREIKEKTGHVPSADGRYLMGPPAQALEGARWLERGTEVLRRINAAADQCRLGRAAFSEH